MKQVKHAMSMGTWAIGGGEQWGQNDDAISMKAIEAAIDNGINWIDTAPAYGFGHSEELVGKVLAGKRDKVYLATKGGLQWYEDAGQLHLKKDGLSVYRDLSAAGLRRDLELSLKRLNTDYIDLYLTHWQSEAEPFVSVEETMGELMKMKEEGLIGGIGVCNVKPEQIKEYLMYGKLDVIQQKYSMLTRDAESLLPLCEEHQITLQTYSPLEQGLLTDSSARNMSSIRGNIRTNNVWWKEENRKNVIQMLDGWSDLCEKYNCPMSNLVVAWTMKRSKYFNVLCGARKVEQIVENAGSLKVCLSDEDYERMTKDCDQVIAGKK